MDSHLPSEMHKSVSSLTLAHTLALLATPFLLDMFLIAPSSAPHLAHAPNETGAGLTLPVQRAGARALDLALPQPGTELARAAARINDVCDAQLVCGRVHRHQHALRQQQTCETVASKKLACLSLSATAAPVTAMMALATTAGPVGSAAAGPYRLGDFVVETAALSHAGWVHHVVQERARGCGVAGDSRLPHRPALGKMHLSPRLVLPLASQVAYLFLLGITLFTLPQVVFWNTVTHVEGWCQVTEEGNSHRPTVQCDNLP